MRKNYRTVRTRLVLLTLWLAGTWFMVAAGSGCPSPAKLTPEDRRGDIEFLAHWARDYSPLVKLNEKYKGTPSYEALLPKYLEFAEQAQSDEEFYLVVSGYFHVIGASGHAYLVPDDFLKWCGAGTHLGIVNWGITPGQFEKARYWTRLEYRLSTRAHPPFQVMGKDGQYFTGDDWQYDGTSIPKGSEILRVNGMTCARYLDFVKESTLLKYDAYPKGWVDYFLMIVDEGPSFQGWQVDFGLPDGRTLEAFVPKVKGFPAPISAWSGTVETDENCTCIELTEEVGYVRIRSFLPDPLAYLFKEYIRKERKEIAAFLEQAQGRYKKLIIDVRNNGGGDGVYFRDNLIAPFLDEPVTWKHTAGIKRKFLAETKPSVLRFLRKDVSLMQVHAQEVKPPEGFDGAQWVFYEITRQVEPTDRYDFHGRFYVLINGGCASATDCYADAVKRTGLGTLVGRNTGGAGGAAYFTPPMVRLPASGMVFRMEADLGLNADGTFNEIVGTPPDVELPQAKPPASYTKEDLLQDEWIKWVLAGRQDRTDRE
jgi:hypothetical protein